MNFFLLPAYAGKNERGVSGVTLRELHEKDVIQCKTGENLGRIDDVTFGESTAQVENVILRGRRRLFGLLGADDDLVIPWQSLKTIGADVVMVDVTVPPAQPHRRRHWLL